MTSIVHMLGAFKGQPGAWMWLAWLSATLLVLLPPQRGVLAAEPGCILQRAAVPLECMPWDDDILPVTTPAANGCRGLWGALTKKVCRYRRFGYADVALPRSAMWFEYAVCQTCGFYTPGPLATQNGCSCAECPLGKCIPEEESCQGWTWSDGPWLPTASNTTLGEACVAPGAPASDTCGDNVVSIAQECDDGNVWDGDGCSHNCTIEAGFLCLQRPHSAGPRPHCIPDMPLELVEVEGQLHRIPFWPVVEADTYIYASPVQPMFISTVGNRSVLHLLASENPIGMPISENPSPLHNLSLTSWDIHLPSSPPGSPLKFTLVPAQCTLANVGANCSALGETPGAPEAGVCQLIEGVPTCLAPDPDHCAPGFCGFVANGTDTTPEYHGLWHRMPFLYGGPQPIPILSLGLNLPSLHLPASLNPITILLPYFTPP